MRVLFTAAYTSVFGCLATFLLLVTGNLAAPIAAHAACNVLGFPDFGSMAQHPWRRLIGAATLGGVAGLGLYLRALSWGAAGGGLLMWTAARPHI